MAGGEMRRQRLKPSQVRFTQDSIAKCFHNGNSVNAVIPRIEQGKLKSDDFPTICVVNLKGKVYSLDNRRLYLFRVAEYRGLIEDVPVKFVSITRIPKDRFTTRNDGIKVQLRGGNTKTHYRESWLRRMDDAGNWNRPPKKTSKAAEGRIVDTRNISTATSIKSEYVKQTQSHPGAFPSMKLSQNFLSHCEMTTPVAMQSNDQSSPVVKLNESFEYESHKTTDLPGLFRKPEYSASSVSQAQSLKPFNSSPLVRNTLAKIPGENQTTYRSQRKSFRVAVQRNITMDGTNEKGSSDAHCVYKGGGEWGDFIVMANLGLTESDCNISIHLSDSASVPPSPLVRRCKTDDTKYSPTHSDPGRERTYSDSIIVENPELAMSGSNLSLNMSDSASIPKSSTKALQIEVEEKRTNLRKISSTYSADKREKGRGDFVILANLGLAGSDCNSSMHLSDSASLTSLPLPRDCGASDATNGLVRSNLKKKGGRDPTVLENSVFTISSSSLSMHLSDSESIPSSAPLRNRKLSGRRGGQVSRDSMNFVVSKNIPPPCLPGPVPRPPSHQLQRIEAVCRIDDGISSLSGITKEKKWRNPSMSDNKLSLPPHESMSLSSSLGPRTTEVEYSSKKGKKSSRLLRALRRIFYSCCCRGRSCE